MTVVHHQSAMRLTGSTAASLFGEDSIIFVLNYSVGLFKAHLTSKTSIFQLIFFMALFYALEISNIKLLALDARANLAGGERAQGDGSIVRIELVHWFHHSASGTFLRLAHIGVVVNAPASSTPKRYCVPFGDVRIGPPPSGRADDQSINAAGIRCPSPCKPECLCDRLKFVDSWGVRLNAPRRDGSSGFSAPGLNYASRSTRCQS